MRQGRRNKGPVVVSETTEEEEEEAGGEAVAVADVPAGSFSFKLKPKNIRRGGIGRVTPLFISTETHPFNIKKRLSDLMNYPAVSCGVSEGRCFAWLSMTDQCHSEAESRRISLQRRSKLPGIRPPAIQSEP